MDISLNSGSMYIKEGDITSGFTVRNHTISESISEWQPVYGEKNRIKDVYNQMDVVLYHEAAGVTMKLKGCIQKLIYLKLEEGVKDLLL